MNYIDIDNLLGTKIIIITRNNATRFRAIVIGSKTISFDVKDIYHGRKITTLFRRLKSSSLNINIGM